MYLCIICQKRRKYKKHYVTISITNNKIILRKRKAREVGFEPWT
jgi:hypothetical protein